MSGMGLPYGLQAMLKEGHKHLSGLQEAVLKNIEACKQLSQITRSSMGPNGAPCTTLSTTGVGHGVLTLAPPQLAASTSTMCRDPAVHIRL